MGPRNAVLRGAVRMWSLRLGPSVELPIGLRKAALGGAGHMWSQPLGIRWSFIGGTERRTGFRGRHVVTTTGVVFGGAPYGATNC
eukprot:6553699-Pyramimonas_sp.AAC.1